MMMMMMRLSVFRLNRSFIYYAFSELEKSSLPLHSTTVLSRKLEENRWSTAMIPNPPTHAILVLHKDV